MKGESEEFSFHTHPIYLTFPLRQKQNLPLGHKREREKKKNRPAPASAKFAFRFFSLALFFSFWLCSSKLLEHSGSVVQSSDSQRISSYQGQQVIYLWVYLKQRPVPIHNEFILSNNLVVTGRAQFEEGEECFRNPAWNCLLHITSCLVKRSSLLKQYMLST